MLGRYRHVEAKRTQQMAGQVKGNDEQKPPADLCHRVENALVADSIDQIDQQRQPSRKGDRLYRDHKAPLAFAGRRLDLVSVRGPDDLYCLFVLHTANNSPLGQNTIFARANISRQNTFTRMSGERPTTATYKFC